MVVVVVGGYGGGGSGKYIYIYTHTHTVTTSGNDCCIKMGSEESHFNVSLIVRDSHKTVYTDYNILRERRAAKADLNKGPSAYLPQ